MGFPSPAADYIEQRIDLNELLVAHPSNTIFIPCADELKIVDRQLTPVPGRQIYFSYCGVNQFGRYERDYIACEDGEMIYREDLEDVVVIGVVTFGVIWLVEDDRPTI